VADVSDFVADDLPSGAAPLATAERFTPDTIPPAEPPPPGFMSRYWHNIVGLPADAVRAFQGRDTETGEPKFSFPDQPNLFNATGGFEALERAEPIATPALPGQAKAADMDRLQTRQNLHEGLLMGARPEQLQRLLLTAFPGQLTEASPDSHGNPVVLYQGKPYYVAKPGFDVQDLVTATGKTGAGILAASGAGKLTAPLEQPGVVRAVVQAVTQGAAQGAAEAGTGQTVAALGGGGSATTPQEIAMAAAFGGLGTLGGRIASSFWRSWRGTGQMMRSGIDAADTDQVTPAMLTTTGRQIFDNENIDPTGFTVGQLRTLNTRIADQADSLLKQQKGALSGQPTGAGMLLRGERQDVPLTGGQGAMDAGALWQEHLLRARGGRQEMLAFDQMQRDKLTDAALRATGGTQTTEQLGQSIGGKIAAAGKDLADKKDIAYAAFPRLTPQGEAGLPNPITFPQQTVADLKTSLGDINAQVSDTPGIMPKATRAQQIMDDLTAGPFNLGHMERARRDLSTLLDQSEQGGTEFRLITQMKRKLDESVDNAVNGGQITGDPQRIQMLKDARKSNAELRDFWDPKNQNAAQFMQQMESGQLKGQQVYDAMFSTKDLDAGGPLRDIIDHLTSKTGQNSGLLDDVRQAAMKKILFGESGNAYEMNPQRFIDRVNRHLSGQGEPVLRQLGLPIDDIKDLAYLQRGLQASQTPNKSGTATTMLAQGIDRLLARVPFASKLRDTMIDMPALQRQAAETATGFGDRAGARLTPQMFSIPGRYARLPRAGAVGGGLLGGTGDQR